MSATTEQKHRHSWMGEMRACGKTHKNLVGTKWTCEHWTCDKCGAIDPQNYARVNR